MNILLSMKPWLMITIIMVVVLLILVITLLIVKHQKKKKSYQEEQKIIDNYFVNIIESVGTINNIVSVSHIGSRLSFILKDQSLLNIDKLKEIHITGIVKTTKKVTLVVGEMAAKYATSIQNELEALG